MTSKISGACNLCSDYYVCILSSQDGFTPLQIASQNGHRQVAELLLSKGADVNLPNQVLYVSKYKKCCRYSEHC